MSKKLKIQFIRNNNNVAYTILEHEEVDTEQLHVILDSPTRFEHFNVLEFASFKDFKISMVDYLSMVQKEMFPSPKTVDDLKDGDECLVSQDTKEWKERIFVAKIRNRFACEVINWSESFFMWKHCKPLNPKKIVLTRDIQTFHGTEITTCTWEEVNDD